MYMDKIKHCGMYVFFSSLKISVVIDSISLFSTFGKNCSLRLPKCTIKSFSSLNKQIYVNDFTN